MKWVGGLLLIGCLAIAWATAHRPPTDFGPPGDVVVRVYDVGDLLDVPYDPEVEPLVGPKNGLAMVRSRGAGSGEAPVSPQVRRMKELVAMVTAAMGQGAWQVGNVNAIGRRLVVAQSRRGQEQVRTLLEDLRASPRPQVRVEMVWARLDDGELDHLSIREGSEGWSARLVDLAAVERMAGAVAYRGQATCTSGSVARVNCGRVRSVITGAEPALGDGISQAGLVGEARQLLDGASAEVRVSLAPGGAAALVSVRSEVSRMGPGGRPFAWPTPLAAPGQTAPTIEIDRLNLGVQSIAASVSGPTGAGIVVGGTVDADLPPGDPRQLYLIVRVSDWKKNAPAPNR